MNLTERAETLAEEAQKLEFASLEATELLKELAGFCSTLAELVVKQERRIAALEKKNR